VQDDVVTTTQRTDGAIVDWAFYRAGVRDQKVGSFRDATALAVAGEGFVWIGLHEPTAAEFASIAEDFDLHPLAVEDTIKAYQRPKLEHYDASAFVVLKTVAYVDHAHLTASSDIVTTGEVMVFLGQHFVVTVRHGHHGGLAALRRELEQDPERLAFGPSAVLHAVADRIVDTYLEVADSVQDDIDEIETSVFSTERTRDTARIYHLKREVLELKRAIHPLHGPLRALAERPIDVVHPKIREYFRDVEDHLHRASDQVLAFDELLTSILQASLAQLSIAANEDMRRITAWAAMIAVPTMIAGIYGMNFTYMPELDWPIGYPLVLLLIVGICALLYKRFKSAGWL
jgi:magnesium transporter